MTSKGGVYTAEHIRVFHDHLFFFYFLFELILYVFIIFFCNAVSVGTFTDSFKHMRQFMFALLWIFPLDPHTPGSILFIFSPNLSNFNIKSSPCHLLISHGILSATYPALCSFLIMHVSRKHKSP